MTSVKSRPGAILSDAESCLWEILGLAEPRLIKLKALS